MSLRNEHVDKVMDMWESGKNGPMWVSKWLGVLAAKNPADAWIYQEIIYETKPDLIIETGSFYGGGTLFLASILDLIKQGEIISIDNVKYTKPKHPKITWLTGNSVQVDVQDYIKNKAKNRKVLLILDSDHVKEHVLAELEGYGSLATNYIIVEDTWWNPDTIGPWQAVQSWLKNHSEFQIDKSKERYLFTNNPNGFLKRI